MRGCFWRRLSAVLLVALLLGNAGLYWLVNRLSAAVPRAVGAPPPELAAETVRFPSGSGAMLAGWWLPPPADCGAILLLHPLRGHRGTLLERAEWLHGAGYGVLLFDFQGHGESSGQRLTFGELESRDVIAARRFLTEQLPGRPVGLIGVSLGGAAAVLAEEPLQVAAVVLEGVYSTLAEATSNRLRRRIGPLASWLAPPLLQHGRLWFGLDAHRLRPLDRIAQLRAPLLLIAGADDDHTLLAESQALYAHAAEPKSLWVVAGAGHEDFHRCAPAAYEQRVGAFFDTYLPCPASTGAADQRQHPKYQD